MQLFWFEYAQDPTKVVLDKIQAGHVAMISSWSPAAPSMNWHAKTTSESTAILSHDDTDELS